MLSFFFPKIDSRLNTVNPFIRTVVRLLRGFVIKITGRGKNEKRNNFLILFATRILIRLEFDVNCAPRGPILREHWLCFVFIMYSDRASLWI